MTDTATTLTHQSLPHYPSLGDMVSELEDDDKAWRDRKMQSNIEANLPPETGIYTYKQGDDLSKLYDTLGPDGAQRLVRLKSRTRETWSHFFLASLQDQSGKDSVLVEDVAMMKIAGIDITSLDSKYTAYTQTLTDLVGLEGEDRKTRHAELAIDHTAFIDAVMECASKVPTAVELLPLGEVIPEDDPDAETNTSANSAVNNMVSVVEKEADI